ncbi:hypothetical protein QYF61_027519 [Mycteria americana]|uniref:Uncharacterized protein n=1 Tax=Mycteria americana TaxID=33587 RepID=A0AAN7PCG4_MYCAM|nr:hypothetical protein QYF61_027519 [Mycteria americana]
MPPIFIGAGAPATERHMVCHVKHWTGRQKWIPGCNKKHLSTNAFKDLHILLKLWGPELHMVSKGKDNLGYLKSHHPAMSKDIFNSIRLLRAPSNLTLNVSRDGASTTSLGNMFQCFTTLILKNVVLISSLNLPSFSLKPLPLLLSQQALLKYLSPSFL